ncbi:MAG: recombinase RecA [Clostridia bacterium]|nr:recombinase RecA [Clostridia bacterium]
MAAKEVKDVKDKDNKEKFKALDAALAKITKDYGQGAVMKLGQSASTTIDVIPTGNIAIDTALGVGGLPRGRIVEIYGPESSGKTTVALHVAAQAQKLGGVAAFVDAEHALDPTYASALGVDIDELYVSQPDTGEQALEIVEALVRSGAIDVIVVDSVAALVPKDEIEGNMGEAKVGLQARLMSQALRKLAGVISKSNTICIFINQLREKIGVTYGPSETTTGGKALKFYATIRLDVRKAQALKTGEEIIGARTKIKVAKNKVAPPFRVAEVDIYYGYGVSRETSVLDLGVAHDLVNKSGAWYSIGDQRIGQSREAARQYLVNNPAHCDELEGKLREALTGSALVVGGAEVEEEEDEDMEGLEEA